jgi:hypothetical protein
MTPRSIVGSRQICCLRRQSRRVDKHLQDQVINPKVLSLNYKHHKKLKYEIILCLVKISYQLFWFSIILFTIFFIKHFNSYTSSCFKIILIKISLDYISWYMIFPNIKSATYLNVTFISNMMLEKNGEDQLDRSCEKWRSIT